MSEQTAKISLCTGNWLVFIIETMCVYYAVGDEFSNRISGVRSQVIPCEICGGQRDTGTDFSSSSTSVFPCQYHSTNAPYWSSSTCCSYQKDKRAQHSVEMQVFILLPSPEGWNYSWRSCSAMCLSFSRVFTENKQITEVNKMANDVFRGQHTGLTKAYFTFKMASGFTAHT